MNKPKSIPAVLTARWLGIDTSDTHIVYMKADCDVCRSEGFSARTRVHIRSNGHKIVATVHHITSDLLKPGQAGLSRAAWDALEITDGDELYLSHPPYLESFHIVRGKIFGQRFSDDDMNKIISDISKGLFSDVEMAAFVTACTAQDLDLSERVALTSAMVNVGEQLDWGRSPIVDKHCVGGLPGNRTTPIVVAIIAANGLYMPKTSSRAITSPAGTADTMATLTQVDLDMKTLRRVVEQEGGCMAWGGAIMLSPTDDMLIRTERALDIDSDGQLVASVLSKKIAAGASHLILDIPYGPSAKVRSLTAARRLKNSLIQVAGAFDLKVRAIMTESLEPVGSGIGPALEAHDVLAVLHNRADAPADLQERSLQLAGTLLEMAGTVGPEQGYRLARTTLESGAALTKFIAICEAQGGLREPPVAPLIEPVLSTESGHIESINNRKIAQAAKLLGAPDAPSAGIVMKVRLNQHINKGEPLYDLHAETPGELQYAKSYIASNPDLIDIGEP